MKKASRKSSDELRPEYRRSDFASLVRGKYAARVSQATNVVVLEPDIAKAFPTSAAVNDALRVVLQAARAVRRLTNRSTRTRTKAVRAG